MVPPKRGGFYPERKNVNRLMKYGLMTLSITLISTSAVATINFNKIRNESRFTFIHGVFFPTLRVMDESVLEQGALPFASKIYPLTPEGRTDRTLADIPEYNAPLGLSLETAEGRRISMYAIVLQKNSELTLYGVKGESGLALYVNTPGKPLQMIHGKWSN